MQKFPVSGDISVFSAKQSLHGTILISIPGRPAKPCGKKALRYGIMQVTYDAQEMTYKSILIPLFCQLWRKNHSVPKKGTNPGNC